jgi:ribonuclease P protein component
VGNAVIRNRIKRRLREIYRHELTRLKPGLWLVITVKPAASTVSSEELRKEWMRLGNRLAIFAS